MTPTIRSLVLDLDGVITDGTITLTEAGDEVRSVHFHDLDAVASVRRRGVSVAILSGENSPASHRVAARFGIDEATWGAKDKLTELTTLSDRLGFSLAETCYIGDSDRDAPAIEAAGVGMAPLDATPVAQRAADHILSKSGGHGVVAEAVRLLEQSGQIPT